MAYLFALLIVLSQIAAIAAVFALAIVLAVRSRRAAMLWLLSVVARHKMPLTEELETFGEGFLHGDRRRIGRIIGCLEAGSTLAEALSRTPGFVSDDAVLLAHVGERTDQLGEAFAIEAERLARTREAAISQTTSPSLAMLYLIAIPLVIPVIVSGLMIFIIPKLKKIFDDFGSSLPWISEQFIESSELIAKYWYLALFCTMAVILLLAGSLAIGRALTWEIRLPRWITLGGRGRRTSLALRCLHIAARAGAPLSKAIEPMAAAAPNPSDRRVFERIKSRFQRGENLWSSLAAERVISTDEAQLLSSAEVTGNLPWALSLVAQRTDDRNRLWVAATVEIVQPMIVLLLGAGVFFVCVSIFLPLVQLLNDLS